MSALYENDWDEKPLNELELKIKHYEEGLTVGELKKLLEHEDDNNILYFMFKDLDKNSIEIKNIVAVEMRDLDGNIVTNDCGSSLRFVLSKEDLE
jgi:hypothetical protein